MSVDYEMPPPRKLLSLWRGEILAPLHRAHTVRTVVDMVAERRRVKASDILGRSRSRPHVFARQEVMYVVRSIRWEDGTARYSYPDIGRRLGGYDHTTVLHGVAAHAKRYGLGHPDDA
jgi:chromosomal replication initiation ATPase DnaA